MERAGDVEVEHTSSISLTFFFNSLYFPWYLTSSAPAVMPATCDFAFGLDEPEGARGIWWYICWLSG